MHKSQRIRSYPEKLPEDFIAIAILIFSALSLYFLIHYISWGKENVIDYIGFLLFRPLISSTSTKIANLVTFFGTGTFLVPSYLLIIAFLIRNNHSKSAKMISAVAVSALLLGWVLKDVFHRSRPLHHLVSGAGGYSFPSGHAFGGFIFTGVLVYLIWQSGKSFFVKWVLSVLALSFGILIGLSRIYLHVHYTTDVLGSLLMAILWLSFMHIFFRVLYQHNLNLKSANKIANADYYRSEYNLDN
jgi:undecaprenyl-diphosphatase